jgi:hypothetical protein
MILDAGAARGAKEGSAEKGLARAAERWRLSSSEAASDMVCFKVRPRLVSQPNAGGSRRGSRRRFVSARDQMGPDGRR